MTVTKLEFEITPLTVLLVVFACIVVITVLFIMADSPDQKAVDVQREQVHQLRRIADALEAGKRP